VHLEPLRVVACESIGVSIVWVVWVRRRSAARCRMP
jgi:hypothetical protein